MSNVARSVARNVAESVVRNVGNRHSKSFFRYVTLLDTD